MKTRKSPEQLEVRQETRGADGKPIQLGRPVSILGRRGMVSRIYTPYSNGRDWILVLLDRKKRADSATKLDLDEDELGEGSPSIMRLESTDPWVKLL